MSQSTGASRFESFGRRVDAEINNFAPRVEQEVRKTITYLNDEIVPQVRRKSREALYSASEQLQKLADHLHRTPGRKP